MGIEGRITLALVYNILHQGKVRESGHGRSVGEMYVRPVSSLINSHDAFLHNSHDAFLHMYGHLSL